MNTTDSEHEVHAAFTVHKLNDDGLMLAQELAERFNGLLEFTNSIGKDQRLNAIVRTKLEEACFFAKKSMASDLDLQL